MKFFSALLFLISATISAQAELPIDNLTVEESLKIEYIAPGSLVRVSGDNTLTATTISGADLPASGVSAGTYGDSLNIPVPVVDATGRITSISTVPVSAPPSVLTFPIDVPFSAGPNIRGDSDTGIRFISDGLFEFWNNTVPTVLFTPSLITSAVSVSAPDFIYPDKVQNSFLAAPISGAGTPTFRFIQLGDISSSALPSPIQLAPGALSSSGICFDSDTCWFSPGDGQMQFTANTVPTIEIDPGAVEINSTLNVVGNITAANYPPTGAANKFVGFNSLGVLDQISGWNWVDDGALSAYIVRDLNTQSGNYYYFEGPAGSVSDVNNSTSMMTLDHYYDRAQTGASLDGTVMALGVNSRTEGPGYVSQVRAANFTSQCGNGNGGFCQSMEGVNITENIAAGTSVDNTRSLILSANYSSGYMSGDVSRIDVYSTGDIGRNFQLLNLNNTSNISGDNRILLANTQGNVVGNANHVQLFQGGDVGGSLTGFSFDLSGNIGDGVGGDNFQIFNANLGTTNVINGPLNAFNVGNSSTISGDNNFNMFNGYNNGPGYRLGGVAIANNASMTEEIALLRANSQGNARTGTGLDLYMQGVFEDDVQGARISLDVSSDSTGVNGLVINMGNSFSATGEVQSLVANGGRASINSVFNPASGAGFQIGNYFAMNTQIDSELTGSEFLMQITQSNLQLNQPIQAGPFGIGLTGVAIVNQLNVATGISQPFYRAVIAGASNPSGDGHLEEYHAIEFLGMQSFGGSVTVAKKIGVQDANFVGQEFCGSATDCWTFVSNDAAADVWFKKNLFIGSGSGKAPSGVGLNITDGKHTRYVQSSDPAGAANANADTGATCAIDGTDSAFSVDLTTGSGSWALGAQCDITFATAYGASPKCVFSATNGNAAMASANTYLTITSSAISLDFVNADVASTNYKWDVKCVESVN